MARQAYTAEKPVRRAYSLSSAPAEGPALHITVRDMGGFGSAFYGFPIGKHLALEPPRGRFTLPDSDEGELVLVAGGSGVTPFRSCVVHLATYEHSWQVSLLQSAQQVDELPFRDVFETLGRDHAWFHYEPTVTRVADDDPWPHARGRIDTARRKKEHWG